MKHLISLIAIVSTAGLATVFPAVPLGQPVFTDVTTSCGVKYTGFVGTTWDVAFCDVDNDGINDLYCMSHDQGRDRKMSLLYRSNASLSLSDITGSAFGSITATGGGQCAFFVDLDADRDLDLITGSNDGVGCALRNNGDGTFGWYEDFPWYHGNLTAREMTAGDVDGDGDLDIIIGKFQQNLQLARNDGSGVYTVDDLVPLGSEPTCGVTLPILVDLDNDGDLDILSQYLSPFASGIRCSVPRNITVDFWQNNGAGRFEWVSNTHGLIGGEEQCALLVGDFDNDADLDIIQLTEKSRGRNGLNRYYVNDGTGHFTEQASARGLSGNTRYTDNWSKAAMGDLDNDGDIDLYYHSGLWTNDGGGSFNYRELPGYYGRINAAGDLDGDGDLDLAGKQLYYQSAPNDGFWVFRNDADNSDWLIVNVEGGTKNPFGVGAKVYVYDGNRLLGFRQVINAAAIQQPLEQHFGLGSAERVRVEVIFPDGGFTSMEDVNAGQKITISKNSNPIPPSTPAWFAATGTDFGCAELRWATPAATERISEYVLAWGRSQGVYEDSTVVKTADVISEGGTSSYQHCFEADGRYCFVLRAHNSYNLWSAYSPESCADITNDRPQPPSPPANVSVAEVQTGTAQVSWNAVGDVRVTGYRVYHGDRSVQGGQSAAYSDSLDAGAGTTVLISGLTDGTYYFAVRSYTASGETSAYSKEKSLTLPTAKPPADDLGAVVPDGFWANDPRRPLQVTNLPLSWTVRIFDTAGRRVRVYTNEALDGQDWTWDFTNDHGQRVARAMYMVRVTGPDGNVHQSARFLVQSDR